MTSGRLGPAPRWGARDVIVLTVSAAVLAAALVLSAQRTFDFFDMSGFMDSGWRVLSGQRIYFDFFYNAGPVHPYLHALSFAIFGYGKTALLVHLVATNVGILVAVYALARRGLPRLAAAAGGLLTAVCLSGPTSHPWYDTTASLCYVAALVLVERVRPSTRFATGLAVGALVALSFLTKANIGLAALGVCTVALITAGSGWRGVAGCFTGAVCGTAAVLLPLGAQSEFFDQTLRAFGVGERVVDWGKLQLVLTEPSEQAVLISIAALLLLGGVAFVERNLHVVALLLGTTALSVFAIWTGSMVFTTSFSLLGLSAVLLVILARRIPSVAPARPWRRWAALGGAVAATLFLTGLGTRKTIELAAWNWRDYWQPVGWEGDYVMQTPALRGWRAARRYGEPVDRLKVFIEARIPRQESLFIFPEAGVLYGLTGRDSYRKVPFMLDTIGLMRSPRLIGEVRAHFLAEPPDWIILDTLGKDVVIADATTILRNLGLEAYVSDEYALVERFGGFQVLKKKVPTRRQGEP